jgi:sulfur carrier protein ThiS
MEVFIERTNEKKEVFTADANSVETLLSHLGINPDEVLVMCNGALVTDDELLDEEDKIKLLSVVSGG